MFTKNSMDRKGRTDGLVHIPPSQPATLFDAGTSAVALPPTGKKKKSKKTKEPMSGVRRVPLEPIKVEVSGWIFVSLADLQSDVNPVPCVSIALVSLIS